MIRSILIAAALSAMAGAASAADITVSLAGKDQATIQADVAKAAKLVCASIDVAIDDYAPCVAQAYDDAMSQVAKGKAAK